MKRINRVIEVDVDSDRNNDVIIRVVSTTPHRDEPIPDDPNIKQDIQVLATGLIAAILYAEKTGAFESGEAMKRTIDFLNGRYADYEVEVRGAAFDEQGNKIDK
jgi:hypothetical protein